MTLRIGDPGCCADPSGSVPPAPPQALAVLAAVTIAVVLAVMVGGCAGPTAATASTATTIASTTALTARLPGILSPAPAADPTPPAMPAVGAADGARRCRVRGSGLDVLPDPACTPGASDSAVTPATIGTTICARGWTATVRPAEALTEQLKVAQLRAYGEAGPLHVYEEDHLIPLDLGGAAADPRNLWPEPGPSPNPKDRVEDAARRAVCDHRLALAAAQQAIAADWMALGRQLGAD